MEGDEFLDPALWVHEASSRDRDPLHEAHELEGSAVVLTVQAE